MTTVGPGTLGLPERTGRELEALASRLGDRRGAALVEAIRRTTEVDSVTRGLLRIQEAVLGAPGAEALATRLVLASESMQRLLQRRPGLLRWVHRSATTSAQLDPVALADGLAALLRRGNGEDIEDLLRRLRRFKARQALRLAARDVWFGVSMETLGREQTALAEALLRDALPALEAPLRRRYGAPVPEGFVVLGLGKLGGEDLNWSSDIDLVLVHRGDGMTEGGTGGSVPTVTYYTRLAEALARSMSTVTEDGFCFRVDLDLRPQGRAGAAVSSLPSMLQYYEQQGRTWERAAWIKARPVAGDGALGQELLEGLGPFVWRRTLDLAAVEALRDLKMQIDLRSTARESDVKLGPGGIREVEFVAAALQLLHGGRNPALRVRSTQRALRRLVEAGLLSQADADRLLEAYAFLRRVENRLQMVDDRQTQVVPPPGPERDRLAHSLGFADAGGFEAELHRHRTYVAQAFHVLLGQEARGELPQEPDLVVALDDDLDDGARAEALARRGFDDPAAGLASLQRLRRVLGAARLEEGPGPSAIALHLLQGAARSPDPDQALFYLADFASALSVPAGYLRLLESRPAVARRLLDLFGQSSYLSTELVRTPELLDQLVSWDAEALHKSPERIRSELDGRAARATEDPEQLLGALRRFKNEEVFRVGLGDIAGDLEVPEVALQLTALADGLLDQAMLLAAEHARARWGVPRMRDGRRAPLAVLGMGKLGGRELGYHSDLDLLFVYGSSADEETTGGTAGRIGHHEYFARMVQRLLSLLTLQFREGRLYQVDTRLRPSGNQGPLVVSEEALLEHHTRRAQLWERQALVKARAVAGDVAYGERLLGTALAPLVWERPLPEGAAEEIHRLRMRMEREVAAESVDQLNPKTGQGGLVDVEFATQYLQLVHGGALPAVRQPGTLDALAALAARGKLRREDAGELREGYLFLRRVENRQRLVHGRALQHLPTRGRPLLLLARRLGYGGPDAGSAFLSEYRAVAATVRAAYVRVLEQ
ncbi:MAG TPA: bifunctional [glutamate--ammonia ligase]-adenylyl-L-tyrosine phosphorylase/[glutamate--ammonia-ligase] adenylyltransferase [Myxococcaceae bacterium]|nr:bifunctional [glutamate--ammonia ligase]-adenylyl-L-tyrosine phosphorylase/[glutamate--ammonia-ligase] adenylyltransferase [Myxococcaceae bacterium]